MVALIWRICCILKHAHTATSCTNTHTVTWIDWHTDAQIHRYTDTQMHRYIYTFKERQATAGYFAHFVVGGGG